MNDNTHNQLIDPFDDFLRQQLQGSHHYIDDAGFSVQVMAALPKPRRLSRWLETLILAVPVTLIALLVASQFSLRDIIQPVYAWVLTMDMASLVSLGLAVALLMVLVPLLVIFRPRSLF